MKLIVVPDHFAHPHYRLRRFASSLRYHSDLVGFGFIFGPFLGVIQMGLLTSRGHGLLFRSLDICLGNYIKKIYVFWTLLTFPRASLKSSLFLIGLIREAILKENLLIFGHCPNCLDLPPHCFPGHL